MESVDVPVETVTAKVNAPVDTIQAPTGAGVVIEAKESETPGKYTGQCKWFNDKLGYGFVTICDGDDKGKDIFVHHSGVKPLNSNYKTLRKGEYIQFNVIDGMNGLQAVDVRGIGGGPLMCDFVSTKKVMPQPTSAPPPRYANTGAPTPRPGTSWQVVQRQARPSKYAPRSAGAANGEAPVRHVKRSYRQDESR